MLDVSSTILDISVIIPFKDKAKMTAQCVDSLVLFGPAVKEILLISNNSSLEELTKLRQALQDHKNVKIIEHNVPFNYQKINNWAVRQSSGGYIFFLNNDTEFVEESKNLVEKMYEKAKQPKVGMVGCLLLYGDQKTIQHAGVFLKPGLQGDHIYVGQLYKKVLEDSGSTEFPYDIKQSRPLTAVTGAAQVIKRKIFDAVDGLDERFIICGGDVDLCIRLNKAGYQTWYQTGGYIIHKESQSRSYKPVPYIDFYHSYNSYLSAFDLKKGDPFVPKITEVML